MILPQWRIRAFVLRILCPLFFKKIGRGTFFTGRVRLPLPLRNVWIGENCMIGPDVWFQTGRNSHIFVGNNSSLNTGCHVVASESIKIGDNVAIGEYVSIRDQDHYFTPATGVRGQGYKVAPVLVESNVWIGRGVYIGPGSVVRSGTIVAANSVVRGDYPANVLLAGAPARIRRCILPDGKTVPPSSHAN